MAGGRQDKHPPPRPGSAATGAGPAMRPQKWTTCGDSTSSAVSLRSGSWTSSARWSRHGRFRPYFTAALSPHPVSWFEVGLVRSVPNTSNRIGLRIKRLCAIERMRGTSEGAEVLCALELFCQDAWGTWPTAHGQRLLELEGRPSPRWSPGCRRRGLRALPVWRGAVACPIGSWAGRSRNALERVRLRRRAVRPPPS
jgi:hypothetical protein